MRCKRHTVDFSSSIGVCASCLRERLLSLAASTAVSENDDSNHRQLHSRISPPRSVSSRNSDAGKGASFNNRFFATPQVKKKLGGLFRKKSEYFDSSYDASSFSSSSSSSSRRSWISKAFSIRSKKQCYIEDLIVSDHQNQRFCRGMSPAEDIPRTTPAFGTPGGRKTSAIGLGKSVSDMAFCLSPLVRANAHCSYKWRGKFSADFGYSGELKPPAKPHIGKAASFSSNRSKKLVDLGRVDLRR